MRTTPLASFPRIINCALLAAATVALWPMTAAGQTNEPPKIVFLHLRLVPSKTVTLIESRTRNGTLKPQPVSNDADALHFELLTADGRSFWHGAIADPSERVVEYEDPPRSGKLKRKRYSLGETEFTLRLPFSADARTVEFYRLDAAGQSTNVVKKSIGVVALTGK